MSGKAFVVLSAVLAASAVHAQEAPIDQKFFIRGSLYFPAMTTTLRIDPTITTGTGSDVSLERDLRFDRRPLVGAGEIGWRFSDNWRASFEFLALSREQTAIIDRQLTIGDTVYPVNGSVTGKLRSNLYKIQLGYSFLRTENAELGASLGVHLTDFATSLEGQGTIGGSGPLQGRTETRSILAPLPNIGAYGHVKLFGPVYATGRLNWLQLKIDNYKGGLTDADLGLSWRLSRTFSATASWRILSYRLDVERKAFEGSIRYRFSGPSVGVTATF